MITCTRKIEFDAGHRVPGHSNKCKFLHGHRYVLEVRACAEQLDELGMVVDFGFMKNTIKSWIDANLDHNVILHKQDEELGKFISKFTGQKIYYLDVIPTAENIALHLKLDVVPSLFNTKNLKIEGLRLYETPNCFVEV
jgi:6-pyruvoyltetrahydropterin/6-carboxytetrahydropterin synthase